MAKTDPTKTRLLRRRFEADVRKRMNLLKKKLRNLIAEENAFGLGKQFAQNTRFAFQTDTEKLAQFRLILQELLEDTVLPNDLESLGDAYWTQYTIEAYERGQKRSFDAIQKSRAESGAAFTAAREQFLSDSFNRPVSISRVQALAGRTYTELKGVTEAISQNMSRILVEGLATGASPRTVARQMAKEIDSITKRRALVIARTETIRAHAEGQLDSFEAQGLAKVGVQVEWSTTGDDRVCPRCQPLEGVVLKLKEARGILPRHPNCRCAFLPALEETKKKGQKRTKAQKKKAIDDSIRAEIPKKQRKKRSLKMQKKLSQWEGANL